jgi:hypothetical protein
MTRRIYVVGLMVGIAAFYLPLVLTVRGPSAFKTLLVAPFLATDLAVQQARFSYGEPILTLCFQLFLLVLVIFPASRGFAGRKMVLLSFLGWLAFLLFLIPSFVLATGGA